MVLDTDMTISYKCPFCGSFEFFSFSLFKIKDNQAYDLKCHCGNSCVTVNKHGAKGLYLSVPCIGCGGVHRYRVQNHILKRSGIKEYLCSVTGIQQCIIGADREVRQKVDCLEREFDNIADMLGYDRYFKNNRVMLDALNKIHDIAENKELYCECGNEDIELALLSGSIGLKCRSCGSNEIVNAASNEDLKKLLAQNSIVIKKKGNRVYSGTPYPHRSGRVILNAVKNLIASEK